MYESKLNKAKVFVGLQSQTLYLSLRDPRLPLLARMVFWLSIAYLVCPIDVRSDFLPGGFADDSVITPLLVLLGYFCIPSSILKDSRKIAHTATYGLMCVALSGTALALPIEAASCWLDESASAQFSVETPGSLPLAPAANACYRCELDDTNLTTLDESNAVEDFLSNNSDKGKQLAYSSSRSITTANPVSAKTPTILRTELLRVCAVWIGSRGHQLQLYSSGDDTDAPALSRLTYCRSRPPLMKKGGLFLVLNGPHSLRVHSLNSKSTKQFTLRATISSSKNNAHGFSQYRLITHSYEKKPTKIWLIHQSLLL